MLDAWAPGQIDLRTASTVGIYVDANRSLRFFDIQVSTPDKLDDLYKAQAEAYANDNELIGRTNMIQVSPLTTDRGIVPVGYQHPTLKGDLGSPARLQELTILVNLYDKIGRNIISTEKTHIKLTQSTNKSWWITPPYAKFVSIIYQVNTGQKISMDFRSIGTDGIDVKPSGRLVDS